MHEAAETTTKARRAVVVLGCGYVGTEVAKRCRARGQPVTALVRTEARADSLRALGLRVIVANLAWDSWHDSFDARDADVVNTVSAGGRGYEGYVENYVDGWRSIRRWLTSCGPARTCVYTSSTAVYGPEAGPRVDEGSLASPHSPSAELLFVAEKGAREAAKHTAGRVFILRLAGIYGPGRHHLLDQVRTTPLAIAGVPTATLNLIHRDDAAAAILACLDAPDAVPSATYNVCDGAPASRGEIVGWLGEQLGVSPIAFTGQPASGRRALTPDRIVIAERIRHDLGWSPRFTSFREGYGAILAPEV